MHNAPTKASAFCINNVISAISMTDMAIRLKGAREKAGYTSARLAAQAMGLPVATYIQHENGTRGYPASKAEKYANFGDYPLGIRRLTLLDSHLYMRYMTLKAWRLIAIFAVSACLLLATTVTYGLWAYGNNLDAFLDAAPICYADHRKYDSIAAANAIGRLDFISFLLTAGGILFAIFAFVGFWVVRREVVDEASRVASNEARKVAQRYYNNDENRGGTNGGDKSKEGRYKKGSSSTARRDTSEVPTAGAVEETGAEDV